MDFFLFSEVATIQQTDSTAHKLKPRLFYKSAHLQVLLTDFYLQYEPCLTSLQITEEASERTTEYINKMLVVLVPTQENRQTELSKNIVSDPGWFDEDRTKFKD